jgi:hypothetical protein
MIFSQIRHKPAHYIVTFFHIHHRWINPLLMFYKIRHGWRTNSPVSMDPPIVFCLHGMNISCWSHMSDLHRKKNLTTKYNNMSPWCPHASSPLDWNFFKMKLKMLKIGFEPMTPWQLEDYTTKLLLHLCCCASYYFFVLCSVYWFCPVSMVIGLTYQVQSAW